MKTELRSGGSTNYRLLGLLSLLLASGVIFFHTPAQLYDANANHFSSSLSALFLSITPVFAVVLATLAIPLMSPNRSLQRTWAVVWFALAVTVWVSSSFLVLNMGPLDGRLTSLQIPGPFALASCVVLAGVVAGSALMAVRLPRFANTVVSILNILLLGMTVSIFVKNSASKEHQDPTAALLRLSTSRNVLVVLLDSLQADLFDDIIASNSKLRDEFEGFTFFPDTVAPAATTYVSMPTIHSGISHDPDKSLSQIYDEQVRHGSFLVSLARAGYDTFTLDPVQGVCPEHSTCATAETILAGVRFTAVQEYLRLLDLSLFRAAPAQAKRVLFNGGAWRTRRWAGHHGDNRADRSQRLLRALAEGIEVRGETPVAKLLHLFNTHPPAELNEGCAALAAPLQLSRRTMLAQSRCAVQALAELLSTLKARGAYDNSVIVVLGDHGIGFESSYVDSKNSGITGWQTLVGTANSVLLFKPLNARGKLRKSDQPAHAGDVFAIVGNPTSDSINISTTGQSKLRDRLYHHYTWVNELWYADRIPDLKTFAIRGPVWSINSWSRIRRPLLKLSKPVPFVAGAAGSGAASFLDWGWSDFEGWGVWSLGSQSSLSFAIERELRRRPIRLEAKLRAEVARKHPKLAVRVEANGSELAVWRFDLQHAAGTYEAILPPGIWSPEDNGVTIRLHFDEPIIPSNVGPRKDLRPLRIGIESLSLHSM